MLRLAWLSVAIIIFTGCDAEPPRSFVPIVTTRPSPVSQVEPATETLPVAYYYRAITVGEEFRDTFVGNLLMYQLTAPKSGTLVAKLNWDASITGTSLMITVGDQPFHASPREQPSLVGRMAVSAGQTYIVKIEEGWSPWDYYFTNTLLLVTSIESAAFLIDNPLRCDCRQRNERTSRVQGSRRPCAASR
jgi:hypothetical protein